MKASVFPDPPTATRPPRLWVACAALTAVTLVAALIVGWVGFAGHGVSGLWAAAVAAGVCWFGAMSALLLTAIASNPKQAVGRHLLGMGFRMGIPLVVGFLLHRQGGALSKAGVFGMILAFYLLTLIVETWLSLRLLAPATRRPKVTEAP